MESIVHEMDSPLFRPPLGRAGTPGPDLALAHGPDQDAFVLVHGEVLQLSAQSNLIAMDPVVFNVSDDEQGSKVLVPVAVDLDHITDLDRGPVGWRCHRSGRGGFHV